MSNNVSDKDCLTCKIPLQHKYKPRKDLLGLSEVSPKDKTWDKHRANVDIVAAHYAVGEKG